MRYPPIHNLAWLSRLGLALLALLVGTLAGWAQTQVITETFQNSTAPGWSFYGTGYTPNLTSGNGDPSGSGWLKLTDTGNNRATAAVYDTAFNSANTTVYATFNFQAYGGTGGNNGGDGIVFFLFDGSEAFSVGAYGGSIGYAQKTGIDGLAGGYLGVALDEYGNFSAASEGRVGGYNGTNDPVPDSISVRGPGDGQSGYAFLGGSGTLAQSIDSVARPTQTNTVQILLSATNQLTVTLQQGGTTPQTVLQMDLSGYARPDTLKFGFSSGSGDATNNHLINNLTISTIVASLWSNNGGNSAWTTNTNWNPTVVPAIGSDILFDNTYVSTAQTIAVGSNQTVRSIAFDAPFAYTLNNSTITFDADGTAGFSGLNVSSTHGTSTFTVNSALSAANDITFRNNTTGTLQVNGNVALNGHTLTIDGNGSNTTIAGQVSGTGGITKNDTGTATLSGNNSGLSGTIDLNNGTLNANHANALGTGTVRLDGGTLASTNSTTVGNTLTLGANSGLANITTSGTLTQSGGSYTLDLTNATQSGAVNLSENSTNRTLTVEVDSGTSTISGVIANGGGSTAGNLTKTGAGELVLSGANTYAGTTTINDGKITLGASNRLADSSDLTIGSSGTFNLNGYSERVDVLTASGGGATIDFGSPSGANTFVFNTYVAPPSGVLVVNNFQSGTDTFGALTSGQDVSTIYISGYGVADIAGSTTSSAYGNIYAVTATAATYKEWDGSSNSNWGTNNNWTSPGEPDTNQIALFGSLGLGRLTATLDQNDTIAGIRFSSAATSSYTLNQSGTRTLTLAGAVPYIQQQSGVNQTISGFTLALDANTVADITGAGNLTINSVISNASGSRSLIRDGNGAGILILGGNNTYSGGLYVNQGIVRASNSGALGTGTANIYDGGTLQLNGGISIDEAVNVTGQGSGGIGALNNFSGSNTLSGTVTQTGATRITANTGTTLNLTGNLTGTNTATTFAAAGTGVINVNRITTGTGAVTIESGTVNYNGTTNANTYTGLTTVASGASLTLNKTAGTDAIGSGGLQINSGTVTLSANNQINDNATVALAGTGTLNVNGRTETVGAINSTSSSASITLGAGSLTISGPNNANSTFAGSLSGTGASSLNLTGTGATYLSGNNSSFAGAANVSSGTLNVSGNNNVLGTSTVNVTGSGNFQIQGGLTLANTVNITGSGPNGNGAIQNVAGANTLTGNITLTGTSRINSDAGTLNLNGTVALGANALTVGGNGNTTLGAAGELSGSGTLTKDGIGTLTLNGANAFTGAVIVDEGILQMGANNALNTTANLTVENGGTVKFATFSEAVGSVTLNAGGLLDFGTSGQLTLASGASTFSGALAGSGTLVIGAGSSLTLNGNYNLSSLNIVLAGGTLNLNGSTSTFGNLTVTGNSVLDFGNAINSTLTVNSVSFSGANTLTVNNWTDLSDYFYSNSSPGTQGAAPMNQVIFNGFNGNASRYLGDNQISPVPEPAHYGAMLLGLSTAAVWFVRRRRPPHRCAAATPGRIHRRPWSRGASAPARPRRPPRMVRQPAGQVMLPVSRPRWSVPPIQACCAAVARPIAFPPCPTRSRNRRPSSTAPSAPSPAASAAASASSSSPCRSTSPAAAARTSGTSTATTTSISNSARAPCSTATRRPAWRTRSPPRPAWARTGPPRANSNPRSPSACRK